MAELPDTDLRAQRHAHRRREVRRRRALAAIHESGTVTKLRTSDMKPLQTIDDCYHPIGITYDRPTRRVWVACYTGTNRVYDDK